MGTDLTGKLEALLQAVRDTENAMTGPAAQLWEKYDPIEAELAKKVDEMSHKIKDFQREILKKRLRPEC